MYVELKNRNRDKSGRQSGGVEGGEFLKCCSRVAILFP